MIYLLSFPSFRFFARFTLLFFFGLLSFYSYSISLSDSAQVSLLTVSPGDELYSAFGHTGIRVTDYKNNFDIVFNYGTFDFAQPGFYSNFVKGKMRYMVTADRFDDFMNEYIYEKRSVTEQELNLTTEEQQKISAFLFHNALPQNREYFYDFFWDNCATRPRDVFAKILGNKIEYHTDNAGFHTGKTLRGMLKVYVSDRPWVDYGFDLILGMPCEKTASPRDQTFLPDFLEKYFDCATVNGQPFVTKKLTLLKFSSPHSAAGFLPIHLNLLFAIAGFLIWLIERKRKTHFYLFDFILFFIIGLLGMFFLSLWAFTSHYSVPENLNVLWLIPTHFFVSFLLLKKQKPYWLKYYFGTTYVAMILLFILWNWLPQQLNYAVLPLLFLLAFRAALIVKNN